MVSISYCITACNEHQELERLVSLLILRMKSQDEIVIQVDSSNVTKEVLKVIAQEQNMSSRIKLVKFQLNKDFATFKNNANSHCTKDFIFQIDADEYPSDFLLENIHAVLEENDQVDLFNVPRSNTVEGLTESHIQKWRWNLNEQNLVNWPDYQMRIYKRNNDIKWRNKVHEIVSGYKRMAYRPDTSTDWCLYHPKTIERQEKQNNFYETI